LIQHPIYKTFHTDEEKNKVIINDEYLSDTTKTPDALFEHRITAGLFGVNLNRSQKQNIMSFFYEILLILIKKENDKEIIKSYDDEDSSKIMMMMMFGRGKDTKNNDWFFYGVDELILGVLFKFLITTENTYFFLSHQTKFVLEQINYQAAGSVMFNLQKYLDYFKSESVIEQIKKEVMDEVGEPGNDFPRNISIHMYQILLFNLEELTKEELARLARIYNLTKKKIINFFQTKGILGILEKSINDELYNQYITGEEMIKYLKTSNLYFDKSSDKPYTPQILDFFSEIGEINNLLINFMNQYKNLHRYLSRSFLRSIGKESEALSYYSKIYNDNRNNNMNNNMDDLKFYNHKDFSMYKLLCSFDEEKALVIGDSKSKNNEYSLLIAGGEHTNKFFTYLDIYEPELIKKMIDYYKTLKNPYVITHESIARESVAGGYKKNIKISMKNNKNKKYKKYIKKSVKKIRKLRISK
jgi:hypothetical protein